MKTEKQLWVEEMWDECNPNEDQLEMLKSWLSVMKYVSFNLNLAPGQRMPRTAYDEYFTRVALKMIPPIEEQMNNHPTDYVPRLESGIVSGFDKKSDLEEQAKAKRETRKIIGISIVAPLISLIIMWILHG